MVNNMYEKLLNFYNKKLGAYYLVFKYTKVVWYLNWVLLIIMSVCLTTFIGLFIFKELKHVHLLLITPLLITILMIVYLNSKCKKILKNKYNVSPAGYWWRDTSFEEKQVEFLYEYLERNNICSEEPLKYLINLTYKDAEEKKYSGFLWPGVCLAFFIPIWSQLVSHEFKAASSLQSALNISFYLIGIGIIILLYISLLKKGIDSISNEILNGKYRRIKGLGKLLEDVLLIVLSKKPINR